MQTPVTFLAERGDAVADVLRVWLAERKLLDVDSCTKVINARASHLPRVPRTRRDCIFL